VQVVLAARLRVAAAVGAVDRQQAAVARNEGRAVVEQVRGERQVPRRRPRLAVVMSGEAVPDLATATGKRMTPEQQPDAARLIDGQPRAALAASGSAGQGILERATSLLERAIAIEALHPNRAPEIQRESALVDGDLLGRGVGVVLAPVLVPLLVGDPDAPGGVAGERRPGLEAVRGSDLDRGGALGRGAEADVVIPSFIRVPRDHP